jgi:hypothetical protein
MMDATATPRRATFTQKKFGGLYEPGAMILREARGKFEDDKGNAFECSSTMTGQPIVESGQTGRVFVLDWESIINLAVEQGIDAPIESAVPSA